MPETLSSSIYRSIESLSQNALVINSNGVVLFANSSWNTCNFEYGLSSLKDWIGADYSALMQNLSIRPDQWNKLYESFQFILHGDHLIFSSELFIHTTNKGDRVFRLDAFPLILDHPSSSDIFVVSHYDVGPFKEPLIELTPICASCKSIRNAKEEWIIIEHFLQQQLSLQFTHDICPECIRRLYPKYAGAFAH